MRLALPGYPFFVWGAAQTSPLRAEYLANAVEIPSATTDRLCEAAREANLDLVIGVADRHLFLSRAFASQAAAYVIDVGALLSPDDIAKPYRDLARDHPGESSIIDPRGEVIAGPAEGETILMADGSTEAILNAKVRCDIAGHYSRPDLFQLRVNRASHCRVVDTQKPECEAVEREPATEGQSG